MGRSRRDAAAAAATPQGAQRPDPTPCVERGNFTHAFCPHCGWEGPARRARGIAVHDGQLHALTGCGGTAEGEQLREQLQDQREESVPDRERLSAHGRS